MKYPMEIDVVYTWVNHQDPSWQKLYNDFIAKEKDLHPTSLSIARFQNRNELTYSINSLRKHAPWVRKIFIVTNCTLPESISRIKNVYLVRHEDIFHEKKHLPTFNSHAIECNLHHIKEISDNFLYFNDDIFLCQNVKPNDFFNSEGKSYFFPSKNKTINNKNKYKPIDFSINNVANLLSEDFKINITHKLHHSIFALNKNILNEMEIKYKQHFDKTSSKKFRANSDIAVATTFFAYYSFLTSRSIPKKIESKYIDISDPKFILLILPFAAVWRKKYITLCINEVKHWKYFSKFQNKIVDFFLKSMFK